MLRSALRNSKVIITLITFLVSYSLMAQNSFLPQNLGENINTFYAEINPVVSADGKSLYFTRVVPPFSLGEWEKQEIWYSELQGDGTWGKAVKMSSNLNIARFNSVLSVSEDGKTLLINGIFNKKGTVWKKRGLSTITKTETSWSAPEKVNVSKYSKKNKGQYSNAFMSNDGNFLVLSFSKGYNRKNSKIYVSQKKGTKWKSPKKLAKAVNGKGSIEAPSLSPDNKTLYFTKKTNGKADIYYSTRTDESWKKWSEAKKLSDTINSENWESYFKTNAKGSYAYFSSENKSKGQADIYVVKLFEENPFVMINGKIINEVNNQALSSRYSVKVLVDDKILDSVRINADSSTYSLKLPFGRKYQLAASVPHFTAKTATIDATQINEFTKVEKNLFVKPLPYVLVSGKVSSKESNQLIAEEAAPKILINGAVVDSVKIDPSTGNYSLFLPYGKDYTVSASALKHKGTKESLILSDVNEYKEIVLNLSLDLIKEKVATIEGFVYDKKTGKPVQSNVPIKLFINDQEASNVKIDSLTGAYQITVPLKAVYTVNASAPNYYPVFETIDLSGESENVKVMKDLSIVPIEVGQSVRLNNIFFASGKTTLMKESFPELDRVVQFLKENDNIKVEIAGHTDNVGKAATNMTLSVGRAKSVANYIISKGVAKEQISSKGYGLTKPVADNKTKEGKALNRRVEFTILDK